MGEHGSDLFDSYDAIATPFGVVIGEDGRVLRAEPLGSREDLPDLLTALPAAPGDAGTTPAPAPGTAARTRSAR
ncbi:hypothetical protein GCM10009716_14250 [Streptomyces sodiiphilus]|uniref:Redoxin domain-containing protein n=1 Tax=Streptomyces sodiiphilus TaxID=226217 RepID=A0ABP5A6V3_9ACTN